jgi:serine/threonine protein kinase
MKVLPKDFASDADRLKRFEQEAKTLAALNHPNILTIHDAGVHEGAPYLVSELLEGQTLREEMNAGALPVRKASEYALQIARGLAAAHGRGIIHRDLKPENVFVTKDGRVKILDFGLAKLKEEQKADSRQRKSSVDADAPTVAEETEPGRVMGTPSYMSPEQVRGQPSDHRTDIFAFGCVLYEMLSGTKAFRRDTPVESMNAVLKEEPPDLSATNPNAPPALEAVLQRCLEKQPEHRFQSAQDLGFAIEVAATGAQKRAAGDAVGTNRWSRGRVLLTASSLVVLAFFGGLLASTLRHSPRPSTVPSIRYLTYSGRDYSPAVASDGKRVCFSSDRDGTKRIWIKEIATGLESPVTSGPDDFPRFSRDGSMILFTRASGTRRALFRLSLIAGEPAKIVDNALSGDWSPNGRQVTFIRWPEAGGSELYTIGIDGSAETLVHRFAGPRGSSPRWSPDGRSILVPINETSHPQSLAVIDLATRRVRSWPAPHPANRQSCAAWDKDGQSIICMQAESGSANSSGSTAVLFRFGLQSGEFQKLLWSPQHANIVDVLPNGNIVMDARSSREALREVPIKGVGKPRSLTLGGSTDRQPTYSPDGKDVVFSSNRSGNLELWSVSRATLATRPLTDDPADDWDPDLSSDGKNLVWSAYRSGNLEIWIANADGTSPRQVTHDGFAAENPTMTPDGRWIVYTSTHPEKSGLWKIHPDGTGGTRLCNSPTAGNAEVSPDGRYAAYVDRKRTSLAVVRVLEVESGAPVPFEIQVPVIKESAAIMGRLRWMPDGKSLVYLAQDASGVNGVYMQDFVPGKDTSDTRRPLVEFDQENSAESFGISPDGQFITIATWEQFFSIMVTEGLDERLFIR